jgi:hypothetical protein
MVKTCSGTSIAPRIVPFDAILPEGLNYPEWRHGEGRSYNDEDFAFLRLTVDTKQNIVIGEFFAAFNESKPNLRVLSDSFVLRL